MGKASFWESCLYAMERFGLGAVGIWSLRLSFRCWYFLSSSRTELHNFFFRSHPQHIEVPGTRDRIWAAAAGLYHSCGSSESLTHSRNSQSLIFSNSLDCSVAKNYYRKRERVELQGQHVIWEPGGISVLSTPTKQDESCSSRWLSAAHLKTARINKLGPSHPQLGSPCESQNNPSALWSRPEGSRSFFLPSLQSSASSDPWWNLDAKNKMGKGQFPESSLKTPLRPAVPRASHLPPSQTFMWGLEQHRLCCGFRENFRTKPSLLLMTFEPFSRWGGEVESNTGVSAYLLAGSTCHQNNWCVT